MRNGSESAAAAVVAAIVGLLLLLVVAGGGYAYFARSQRITAAVAEMEARHAEYAATLQQKIAAETDEVNTESRAAIESVLRTQQDAWNAGDIDAFMEHYWKSDALTFSSGGDTTRGWTATLNRYRERYPTRDQMGRLALSDFEITTLGDSAAMVLGRWQVERDSEPLSGNFSLVMRKIDDRWVVVHDHTSRTAE
jgi:beta-aspartyl-peptidase (threonine type)